MIQDVQLSITGENMCTSTGYLFRGLSLPRKKCEQVKSLAQLSLNNVDWVLKLQHTKKKKKGQNQYK